MAVHIDPRLYAALGAVYAQRREYRGLTQRQLAQRTGLHLRTIQQLETGASRPNRWWRDTACRVADVLGYRSADLLVAAQLAAGHGPQDAAAEQALAQQVRHLYTDTGLTQAETAQRLGVHRSVVTRIMRDHHIPLHPPTGRPRTTSPAVQARRQEVARARAAGARTDELAAHFGVCPSVIRSDYKHLGLTGHVKHRSGPRKRRDVPTAGVRIRGAVECAAALAVKRHLPTPADRLAALQALGLAPYPRGRRRRAPLQETV